METEKEPPRKPDDTGLLIAETETIIAARADVRKALQLLREANGLLKTDILPETETHDE